MMKDLHNDPVLELDRPRTLRLTHKALKTFTQSTGLRLGQMAFALDNYDQMTELVYCMLKAEDPELDREKLDDMLEELTPKQLIEAVNAAVENAFPTDDGSAESEGKSEENPTTGTAL